MSPTIIPPLSNLVVSFRTDSPDSQSVIHVAFIVANLCRDLYADGNKCAKITNLFIRSEADCTIGIVVFNRVVRTFFARAETTPFFDLHPSIPNTYIASWPLCNNVLTAIRLINEILFTTK